MMYLKLYTVSQIFKCSNIKKIPCYTWYIQCDTDWWILSENGSHSTLWQALANFPVENIKYTILAKCKVVFKY